MSERILRVQGLWKSFGGLWALESLDFIVAEQQIKSFIGPNGAGKTTLFNVITGIFPPSEGTFEFAGKSLNGLKPHAIARLGISRTFQNLALFGNMSVLENVMLKDCWRSPGPWRRNPGYYSSTSPPPG
jgi:branched-chain amino acid transport system ATP-binding protein